MHTRSMYVMIASVIANTMTRWRVQVGAAACCVLTAFSALVIRFGAWGLVIGGSLGFGFWCLELSVRPAAAFTFVFFQQRGQARNDFRILAVDVVVFRNVFVKFVKLAGIGAGVAFAP